MVGGTGARNWVDSQTRSGAILQQPDLRHEQYGGVGGWQRGSHPFPPGPWAAAVAGEAGRLGAAGVRSPQCPAHSKVSHCFLSCSTEPGAGAGLTSCLVFRSKSSKGSLVS